MKCRIALITAYYGKYPSYFQNWLDCAKHNQGIEFYVITDSSMARYDVPLNVKIIEWNFDEIREKFQKLFPFKIRLKTPYKLCDYKPAYGKLLEEYIIDYDWWGYIDIDIIFGDLYKFLSSYLQDDYQRIGRNGHFSIFKNTEETRTIFLKSFPFMDVYKPKEVYKSGHFFAYDEMGGGHFRFGITHGMEQSGIKMADLSEHVADIYITRMDFSSSRGGVEFRNEVFKWGNGILEEMHMDDGHIISSEIMYVHFQKRSIEVTTDNRNEYYVCPNAILEKYSIETEKRHIFSELENQEWWIDLRRRIRKSRIKSGAFYWVIKDAFILKISKIYGMILAGTINREKTICERNDFSGRHRYKVISANNGNK